MLNYLDELSLNRIRFDDYNVYIITEKMQKNKKDIM